MLESRIEALFEKSPEDFTHQDLETFEEFKRALNAGAARAAEPDPAAPHGWRVNAWSSGAFWSGSAWAGPVDMTDAGSRFTFWDKATYPPRKLTIEDGVRVVPGGSSLRDGCYVGKSVTCMPPMYINVGGYVDDGSMVDSHALVGSCAQIGKNST